MSASMHGRNCFLEREVKIWGVPEPPCRISIITSGVGEVIYTLVQSFHKVQKDGLRSTGLAKEAPATRALACHLPVRAACSTLHSGRFMHAHSMTPNAA